MPIMIEWEWFNTNDPYFSELCPVYRLWLFGTSDSRVDVRYEG